jgi:potassium-dependent mechanosensitive channel
LTQRGSFDRGVARATSARGFNRLGVCFTAASFILIASFLSDTRAQTISPKKPAAQSTPSGTDAQPNQDEGPSPPPNPSQNRAIPLPNIPDRVQELDRLLREINNQLVPEPDLLKVKKETREQAEEIGRRSSRTRELLSENTPTPLALEDEQRYWRARGLEYERERRRLTLRAAKLEEQIQALKAQQPDWMATWMEIRQSSGIETVVARIARQLDNIQVAESQAQGQLNVLLTLQNEVAQTDQQISDTLLRIREVRETERGRLLETDGPPLWSAREEHHNDQGTDTKFHLSFDRSVVTAKEFLLTHKIAVPILVVFYSLALLFVFKLKNQVAHNLRPEISAESACLLNRPFSLALLLVLIGAGKFIVSAPIGIAFLSHLLYLVPIVRLLAPSIQPRLRIFLYVAALLYTAEGAFLLVQIQPVLRRELYALLVLIALIGLSWLIRPSKSLNSVTCSPSQRLPLAGIRGCLLFLVGSLVANIIGFVSLSQVLGLTALAGPFIAVALYCGARVMALLLGIVLRAGWARRLLESRVDTVDRWGSRLLGFGAFFLWLKSMLQLTTLYDSVVEATSKLFKYPIGLEKIHFTLGDAMEVPFILLAGYFLAKAFTLLLRNVILPKFPLKRGLPDSISTVTYYVLLLFVALATLSGAGIELNKFTVLTGALGVGLGFGLQNIVNNFVSGLILLFERPIHIGDTVDVGGLVGVVRRIGARSSTVVTFEGAEVIVPNSNLLSNQVINWTLSSQWRRVDIPVGVAYGTDPERVIKLLVAVAESYPGVLLDRPPMAFFMGFGESSLNFELRFWSAWQDTWFQLKSDVTVAVAKALGQAGIEIPFPQRDLHLRSVDSAVPFGPAEKTWARH